MTPFAGLKSLSRVLCLGAHCDDIEIGAGATILRLLAENPAVQIKWVVFSGRGTVRVKRLIHGIDRHALSKARIYNAVVGTKRRSEITQCA